MKDTLIDDSGMAQNRLAKGYFNGREVPPNKIDTLGGGGALRSTGYDMLRLISATLNPPEGLKDALTLMQTPRAIGAPGSGNRMALGIAVADDGGQPLLETSGSTGGFSSFLLLSDPQDIGVAILANQHGFKASDLAHTVYTLLNNPS